ncbi:MULTISPECIES: ABC transporter permease [unclassified Leifsonia]|uniref:ABC transporter permease n=1 Tax=unclassified Leifsonia TaxID=2663824 RepID=UPI0008A767CB|nr:MULTISPECIES: ABC transporter permease [unclassified Leifsonia]SEH57945.1 ABC-2 type transport system permease protein [Leifsonia sp. CL154]SFL21001.1 ABC-2 type transport system permease protein [Leifsonia sp. CL147]
MTSTALTSPRSLRRGGPTFVTHTALLTGRLLRAAWRMPVFLVMNLVQPIIWLLLFGQLFKAVVEIPGFSAGGSYLEYLTPGVVMMLALFGSAWSGTVYIQDMDRGVMDRLLTSPTNRASMIVSTLVYQSILAMAQSLIVVGIAFWTGARFEGGFSGMLLLLLGVVLLTAVFCSLSNAVALLARDQTALIGISQLITLPLMFLSSAIMNTKLSPEWVRNVAAYNPFEWAVVIGREALSAHPDWASLWGHAGLLAALAVVMAAWATSAFRVYQRSA